MRRCAVTLILILSGCTSIAPAPVPGPTHGRVVLLAVPGEGWGPTNAFSRSLEYRAGYSFQVVKVIEGTWKDDHVTVIAACSGWMRFASMDLEARRVAERVRLTLQWDPAEGLHELVEITPVPRDQ